MPSEDEILIWVIHQIHHNFHRQFSTSDEIDSETGEFKLIVASQVLEPGQIHSVPRALADELLAQAASSLTPCVREPTEREMQAHLSAIGSPIER